MDDENLILELKNEYIADSREDLYEVINKLGNLEKQFDSDLHKEIARKVHSLKGSAGSFNIYEVTSLAQRFEDKFNYLTDKVDYSEFLYSLLDDMLLIFEQYLITQNDKDRQAAIEGIMQKSLASRASGKIKILVAGTSKVFISGIEKVCKDLGEISKTDDGLKTLSRIMTEKFDLVILSKHMPNIGGIGCISAIKSESLKNRKIPYFALVTTEPISKSAAYQPDMIVYKDDNFYKEILKIVTKISSQIEDLKNRSE